MNTDRGKRADPLSRAASERALSVPLVVLTSLSTLAVGAVAALIAVVPVAAIAILVGFEREQVVTYGLWVIALVAATAAIADLPVLFYTIHHSSRMVMHAAHACPVSGLDGQRLRDVVQEMSVAAGLPAAPDVAVIDSPWPNAMVAGRAGTATVHVTSALLEVLDRQELQAVVAHEIAHIKAGDIRFKTYLAAILIRFDMVRESLGQDLERSDTPGVGGYAPANININFIAGPLLVAVAVVKIPARIFGLGASRLREFGADDGAVWLTRDADALIRALTKLTQFHETGFVANQSLAHLFIVGPARTGWRLERRLLATHPPLHERIWRLKQLAGA